MRSKTNFKEMYLVDATAYNKINNTSTTTTSTPIILGKSNTQISPPALNVSVSAPITTEKLILVLNPQHLLVYRVMYYIQNP